MYVQQFLVWEPIFVQILSCTNTNKEMLCTMNYTGNYQLPQWEKSDRIMMEDFNDMTAKMDASLTQIAAVAAQHGQTIPLLGNCRVQVGSYVGNGHSLDPTKAIHIGYTERPIMILIGGMDGGFGVLIGNCPKGLNLAVGYSRLLSAEWTDTGVDWYNAERSNQLNALGVYYHYIIFLPPKS